MAQFCPSFLRCEFVCLLMQAHAEMCVYMYKNEPITEFVFYISCLKKDIFPLTFKFPDSGKMTNYGQKEMRYYGRS